jgi:uncharacterized protein YndB with AHSA1/START domain
MDEPRPIIRFEATVTSKASPDVVYEILGDPSTHLQWAGREAPRQDFRLLTLDAPKGLASVGTRFLSTGANSKDGSSTFHDESIVTEATPPSLFAFVTESHLSRKHRKTWEVRFVHRYEVHPNGVGSRITYTASVYPVNYRPYWLHPLMRPMTKKLVNVFTTKHISNLSRMAENVSGTAEKRIHHSTDS